jgi:hypothetical protein
MVAAGSAGTAKNSRNVVTDTAKRVKTASRTRRMKKRSIGGPFRGVDLFGFAVAGGVELGIRRARAAFPSSHTLL